MSGIVYVIRNGLQWKDAPKGYGPHKTLYNRFMRWRRTRKQHSAEEKIRIWRGFAARSRLPRCAAVAKTLRPSWVSRCLAEGENPGSNILREMADFQRFRLRSYGGKWGAGG